MKYSSNTGKIFFFFFDSDNYENEVMSGLLFLIALLIVVHLTAYLGVLHISGDPSILDYFLYRTLGILDKNFLILIACMCVAIGETSFLHFYI